MNYNTTKSDMLLLIYIFNGVINVHAAGGLDIITIWATRLFAPAKKLARPGK